jgi:Late competence development protein ComFB
MLDEDRRFNNDSRLSNNKPTKALLMGVYKNAMEVLVEEEVDRQVNALPARAASYINRLELVAYALNQLPPLYATSQQGLSYQLQRGRAKLSGHINQAVQRALATVQREPIRTYMPLQPQQSAHLRDVLGQLRLLLKNDQLNWENLPIAVKQALGEKSNTPSRQPQYPPTLSSLNYPIPPAHLPGRRAMPASAVNAPPIRTVPTAAPSPLSQSPAPLPMRPKNSYFPVNDATAQPARKDDDFNGWDDPLYKV